MNHKGEQEDYAKEKLTPVVCEMNDSSHGKNAESLEVPELFFHLRQIVNFLQYLKWEDL